MTNKRSKKKEVKKEKPKDQTGTYVYRSNDEGPEKIFVPDDKKIERVKKQVRADRIVKDRIALDFWLRHELQLGTGQIKKLWNKMDEIYKE